MTIPKKGDKRVFKFVKPFNTIVTERQILTVESIRSLNDIIESGESPFENIYKPFDLTEEDMKDDLDNNIPIVMFITGDKHIYIPADMIAEISTIGIQYCEKVLAINIGLFPSDFNPTSIINDIKDVVLDRLGVSVEPLLMDTSAMNSLTVTEHKNRLLKRDNATRIKKSYKTLYNMAKKDNERLNEIIDCLKDQINKIKDS